MADDDKLAREEARRSQQHGTVKSGVQAEVKSELQASASHKTEADVQRVDAMAGSLRARALDEVADSESEAGRSRGVARVSQVIDYVFYVIYALLGIRFVLSLMAANQGVGFYRFIKGVTDIFYAPFHGIVSSPASAGGSTLALPLLVAVVCYFLLHLGINGFLRLLAKRKTEI